MLQQETLGSFFCTATLAASALFHVSPLAVTGACQGVTDGGVIIDNDNVHRRCAPGSSFPPYDLQGCDP